MTRENGEAASGVVARRDDASMAIARRLLYGDDGGFAIDTAPERRVETAPTSGTTRLRALLDGFGPVGNRSAPFDPAPSDDLRTDIEDAQAISRASALYDQF